jgi:uncharacterized membrane protein YbhN (UPF0104 family)
MNEVNNHIESRDAKPACPEGNKKTRSLLMTIVRLCFSAALLWFLFRKISLYELLSFFAQTADHWQYLGVALIMPATGIMISSMRLGYLLKAQGLQLPFLTICRLNLVSGFYNQILPSTIGGDVFRSLWISRVELASEHGNNASDQILTSFTVIGVDRLVGALGILTTGIVAAAAQPTLFQKAANLTGTLPFAAAIAIGCAIIPFLPGRAVGRFLFSIPLISKLRSKAITIYRALKAYNEALGSLLIALFLSIGLQICIILEYWLLARSLQIPIPLWGFAVLVPIVTMISTIPITIGGIGLRENALLALGSPLGLTPSGAIALAWAFLIVKLIWALFGGIVHLRMRIKPTIEMKPRSSYPQRPPADGRRFNAD